MERSIAELANWAKKIPISTEIFHETRGPWARLSCVTNVRTKIATFTWHYCPKYKPLGQILQRLSRIFSHNSSIKMMRNSQTGYLGSLTHHPKSIHFMLLAKCIHLSSVLIWRYITELILGPFMPTSMVIEAKVRVELSRPQPRFGYGEELPIHQIGQNSVRSI